MSTATAFPDLRSFLNAKLGNGVKDAAAKLAMEMPAEPGKKEPSTGERFTEHEKDVREVVPEGSVESASAPSEFGRSKDVVADSGLEQTVAGQEDSQTRSIKKITDENEKIAKIDLTNKAGIDQAIVSLEAAAEAVKLACFPNSKPAQSPAPSPVAAPQTAAEKSAADIKAAADQAVYNTTRTYMKYGSDRAMITARYLDGFTRTWEFLKAAADDGSLAAMLAAGGGAAGGGAAGPGAPAGPAGPAGADMPAPGPEAAAAPADGDPGDGTSPDAMAGGMNEMNLSPEQIQEIIALLQAQLGDAQAAPDQKAAAAASLAGWSQTVKAAADHMRSGKYQFKPAADGTPARKSRDTAKRYLGELMAYGR